MNASEQGANEINGRWLVIPRTLCFIINGDDMLLMKRAAHKRVFPNRYNGVGGHIERNEDPFTSAKREILEETGLNVNELHLKAVYNIDANDEAGILLFLFFGRTDTRDVVPNSEGTLHWIPISKIFQFDLVEDLPIILPRVLEMSAHDLPLFLHVGYDADDCIQMRFANLE